MDSFLAEAINDSNIDSGEKWETSYNHKTEKSFNGNIIMFRNNKQQYGKRFPVKSCCDGVIPIWEDAMERPEKITVTVDSAFVDTLIEWEFEGDKVLICSECGCIFEGDFREQAIDNREQEEIEPEPTEAEIIEALQEIDITAI
jgi:hypothetical protein